jgi:hypothetical protein
MDDLVPQDRRLIFWGSILIIIGFFLPWYDQTFTFFGLPNHTTSFNGPQLANLPTVTGISTLSIWGILITGIASLLSLFVEDKEGCLALFAQGGVNLIQGVCVIFEIGRFVFGSYGFTTYYYPDSGIELIALGYLMTIVGLYRNHSWQAFKDNIQNLLGQLFGS